MRSLEILLKLDLKNKNSKLKFYVAGVVIDLRFSSIKLFLLLNLGNGVAGTDITSYSWQNMDELKRGRGKEFLEVFLPHFTK